MKGTQTNQTERSKCRCGVELPPVPDNETPPEFCSEACKWDDANEMADRIDETLAKNAHKLPTVATRWNTGNLYTENGQRIAAAPFRGGTLMVDADRGLDYWYPVERPIEDVASQGATSRWISLIMDAYNNNLNEVPKLPFDEAGRSAMWQDYRDLRDSLEQFAKELPSGQYPTKLAHRIGQLPDSINPNQKG